MKVSRVFLIVVSILLTASCVFAQDSSSRKAKNVILMIGDGMGFNSDLAGTYYRYGKEKAQSYHKFPKHLACTTFSITKEDFNPKEVKGYNPEVFWGSYLGGREGTDKTTVTDSAASATAINTGTKTLNGRIGMDFMAKPLKSYAQYVSESGRSVGIVTTVTLCHATPAAVIAHMPSRNMYVAISREQMLDQPVSVLFGGGHPDFDHCKLVTKPEEKRDYKFVGGKYVWNELKKNDGFADAQLITTKDEFESLAAALPGSGKKVPAKVIGVPHAQYLAPVSGGVDNDDAVKQLYSEEEAVGLPSLATMSTAALNVLQQNNKGFYLMIEGGAIDAQNHSRNIDKMVLEHTAFAKAIDAVCAWVEKYSSWDDTLLVITADHETGQLWGPDTYADTNKNRLYDQG
ncbi:MAG: alkaline phosphatase, partial [Thermoguttaceae bacterium]|nr:alkaline phosphatase [Thermoguttaceae bacterium]